MKQYIWKDGSMWYTLPRIIDNASPITEAWWVANGGTVEETPDPPEPEPVVRYSKYRLQLFCQGLGIWDEVKQAISDAGLQDSWLNIQDIASDNPELVAALPAMREAFGAELVDEALAASMAD